jgi:sugar-specific transcriptional regulator TrmB
MDEEYCKSCGGKVIGFDDSAAILVRREKNGIKELDTNNIIKLWNSVTKYSNESNSDSKFQTLIEKNSFLPKLELMVNESSESIMILGTESIFKKFLQKTTVKLLKQTKSDLKILSDFHDENNHSFQDFPLETIRKIGEINKENFCFIIKDNAEAIFFISTKGFKDKLAVWTDSKSFVTTLGSLFNMLWHESDQNEENNSKLEVETTVEQRMQELEQKKIILNYLQSVFKLTEKELESSRDQ